MEEDKLNNIITVMEKEAGGVLYKIVNSKILFLIIHRVKQDDWSLPKGHIETGETLEECALREILEETGWRGKIVSTIGSMDYTNHDKSRNIIKKVSVTFFLVKPIKEERSLIFSEEVDFCKWIEYGDELVSTITYPAQRPLIQRAFEYLKENGETQ